MIISFRNVCHGSTWLLILFMLRLPADGSPARQAQNLLLLGDSISAAYGMSLGEGWAALLQERLTDQNRDWQVINASISGETSAGAGARLPRLLLQYQPQIVVIELGGNDGLRGHPIKHLRNNLRAMITQSRNSGARVLLLGMQIPPNYGIRYTQMFADSYRLIAEEQQVGLVPFLLEGIAIRPELMQADGIHPTAEAQTLLLENVWPQLAPMLEDAN